jgi:hypothetical protein
MEPVLRWERRVKLRESDARDGITVQINMAKPFE